MARKAKPDAVVLEASVNEAAFSQGSENLNALALVNTKVNAAAQALAEELGYDGALSVGTLEDEIRFYQRRTVEACLELGKRLLLLREMTAHGNSCQIGTNQDATRGNSSQIGTNQGFDKRVEQLGFSRSTAYRFMQAAAKTAKSANLAVLSTQVKSASAFLELVTHDSDEDIERVAKLDDIDRMSASQLRAALRESREDAKASEKRRSVLLQQKEKLKRIWPRKKPLRKSALPRLTPRWSSPACCKKPPRGRTRRWPTCAAICAMPLKPCKHWKAGRRALAHRIATSWPVLSMTCKTSLTFCGRISFCRWARSPRDARGA